VQNTVVIAKEEIDAVTQFMNAIRLSSKDKETAINAFRKASSSEQSIYEYASQYRAVASVEMRGVVYAVLCELNDFITKFNIKTMASPINAPTAPLTQ
jgi:hypothetical protein